MRPWQKGLIVAAVATVVVMLLAAGLTRYAAVQFALAPGGLLSALATITGASTPSPAQDAGAAAAPAPFERYGDGSTSERGNVPKMVGQKAGILSSDGRTHVVTFTVTRIVTDPHCLNPGAPPPTNGRYVEVDLQVVTTAGMGIEGGDPTITFTPDNWYFYPPDTPGIVAGGTGASSADDDCDLSVPSLPDSIGASQTLTGSVLLDVAPGSVYLSYNPRAACGCDYAWEWPYSG
ncbi:MAG TPA: hypothetical protein VGM70_06340 [Pseudolysinimonas sp.]